MDSSEENSLSSQTNSSSRSSSPLVLGLSDFTITAQISQTGRLAMLVLNINCQKVGYIERKSGFSHSGVALL